MAEKRISMTISLRRDLESKYELTANKFVPKNGEVCLVDTDKMGLCAIVGDGVSTFSQLKENGYVNSIFVICYIYNNKFYADEKHLNELSGIENKIYVDKSNYSNCYYYLDNKFHKIGSDIPIASVDIAGVMKLYDSVGNNTDGTMNQKVITDELNQRTKLKIDKEAEMAIFD